MNTDITKAMIYNGLANGVIRIINNPNDGCIAAQIKDCWFYFTGSENEDLSVEEYLNTYSRSEIVDMIYDAINAFNYSDEESIEFLYYKSILEAVTQQ